MYLSQIRPRPPWILEALKDFKGYLQTYGHNCYDLVMQRDDITHLGCMAHGRRGFDRALDFNREKAGYALRIFRLLFQVEGMAEEKGKPPDYNKRWRLRQRHSVKLMRIFKNWLFGGSPAGARRAAIFFTLISGCKLNDLNPFDYLLDVASRINGHSAKRINELLPWNWRPAS